MKRIITYITSWVFIVSHFSFAQNEFIIDTSLIYTASNYFSVSKGDINWKKHKYGYYVAYLNNGKSICLDKDGNIINPNVINKSRDNLIQFNDLPLNIRTTLNGFEVIEIRLFKDTSGRVFYVLTNENLMFLNEEGKVVYKLYY